jgi:prepilin-type N-terminal cleavage/methylation domain-containing protein
MEEAIPVRPRQPAARRPRAARRGLTIIEVITVISIIGVLLAAAAPSFIRTMEQAHADLAGANLRAIWSAQRYYWLENRTYAATLAELQAADLLDSAVVAGTSRYGFAIDSADAVSFTASATRTGSTRWSGSFFMDEAGLLTGTVGAAGGPDVVPAF